MYWTGSLIVVAIGAVLRWAITQPVHGVNIHMIGLILLIVGGISFVLSVLSAMSAAARDRDTIRATRGRWRRTEGYPPTV